MSMLSKWTAKENIMLYIIDGLEISYPIFVYGSLRKLDREILQLEFNHKEAGHIEGVK